MNRRRLCHWPKLLPCLLLCATIARADLFVLKGSDYFQTDAGTMFSGVPFMGVPLGTPGLGNTDTIVQRLADADFPSVGTSATVRIQLTALQLESVVPTDFGLGTDFYFITLQTARAGGGQISPGTMTINLNSPNDGTPANPEGTFDSSLDVFFDVRKGSLNGPIALSTDLVLVNSGTSWDADPSPGDLIVPGAVGDQNANLHTGKSSNQMDFFVPRHIGK
jgi:hypothetical protein